MSKILDFKCSYENSTNLDGALARALNIKLPEAHGNWRLLSEAALKLKEHEGRKFCELPLCHTLEGEALGGSINLGDENTGPRVKDYVCKELKEVLELEEIDLSKGRIGEVLKSISSLSNGGENTLIYISGPLTILNMIIDPVYVFKALKKKDPDIYLIFDKIGKEILRFAEEAQRCGVKVISYGDPTGGVNIIGPKLMEEMVDVFTYPLLKEMVRTVDDSSIIALCPKTAFALLGVGKAKWRDIEVERNQSYSDACISVIGKAKMIGQMCIKNRSFTLKNGTIKSIELI